MSRIFDSNKRPWYVEINAATLGRVRKVLDVNLLEVVLPESTLLERLADPVLLVDVLYVLCRPQCDELHVSDEEFGRGLTRDTIDEGWDAILEGVVNFSPRGIRPAYQKVLEKARKFKTVQEARMEDLATGELGTVLDRELAKLLDPASLPTPVSTAVGSLPASSASTPAAIASAN